MLLQSSSYYFLNLSEGRLYTPKFQYEVQEELLGCEIIPTPLLFRCADGIYDVNGDIKNAVLPYKIGNVEIEDNNYQFLCLRKNRHYPFNETHYIVVGGKRPCIVDLSCKWYCYDNITYESALEKAGRADALEMNARMLQLQVEFNKRMDRIAELEQDLSGCSQILEEADQGALMEKERAAALQNQLDSCADELQRLRDDKTAELLEEQYTGLQLEIVRERQKSESEAAKIEALEAKALEYIVQIEQDRLDFADEVESLQKRAEVECPEIPESKDQTAPTAPTMSRAQRSIQIANTLIICFATVALTGYFSLLIAKFPRG